MSNKMEQFPKEEPVFDWNNRELYDVQRTMHKDGSYDELFFNKKTHYTDRVLHYLKDGRKVEDIYDPESHNLVEERVYGAEGEGEKNYIVKKFDESGKIVEFEDKREFDALRKKEREELEEAHRTVRSTSEEEQAIGATKAYLEWRKPDKYPRSGKIGMSVQEEEERSGEEPPTIKERGH